MVTAEEGRSRYKVVVRVEEETAMVGVCKREEVEVEVETGKEEVGVLCMEVGEVGEAQYREGEEEVSWVVEEERILEVVEVGRGRDKREVVVSVAEAAVEKVKVEAEMVKEAAESNGEEEDSRWVVEVRR
ncbi:hypothetical protein J5N97_001627 [Dioscorea zingiberensis]|uniref:Uncharacterized protein n=1 Tax=Dioscorea zingiberensis TaxID=325984 RepID=A0A9D5BTM3_9LILI|nr:hypothetical protein J5N97_001627 [Dioscorea zingiberensis]